MPSSPPRIRRIQILKKQLQRMKSYSLHRDIKFGSASCGCSSLEVPARRKTMVAMWRSPNVLKSQQLQVLSCPMTRHRHLMFRREIRPIAPQLYQSRSSRSRSQNLQMTGCICK